MICWSSHPASLQSSLRLSSMVADDQVWKDHSLTYKRYQEPPMAFQVTLCYHSPLLCTSQPSYHTLALHRQSPYLDLAIAVFPPSHTCLSPHPHTTMASFPQGVFNTSWTSHWVFLLSLGSVLHWPHDNSIHMCYTLCPPVLSESEI